MLIAQKTPLPLARLLARSAAAAAYVLLGERRRMLLRNLAFTAPRRNDKERLELARRTFGNIAECQTDLLRLPGRPPNELLDAIEAHGLEHIRDALALGRGVVVITGHLGNYELGGAWLAAQGYPAHAVVEDVNPAILALLERYRTATGMRTISRNRGARDAYRVLRSGEILLLVSDRVIGDSTDAIEVPFCEGRRAVPTGPATLALATGAPIVVGFVVRTHGGPRRYGVYLEPPIMPDGTEPDAVVTLTRRIAERLSAAVRDYPDQWFVFQPGWMASDR